MEDERQLVYSQAEKLISILSTEVEIQSHADFPSLIVTPVQLLTEIKKNLRNKEIHLKDTRIIGSAASYCVCKDSQAYPRIYYNDIDLVIRVQARDEEDFHVIKQVVMETLVGFLPCTTGGITPQLIEKMYVGKMVLVSNKENRWSLFSFGNAKHASRPATTIELKFEDNIQRKYEFSAHSFQIHLDSFLDLLEASPVIFKWSPMIYPLFTAVSMYEVYDKALCHLNNRLIHTRHPEQIRGGGLLKYCSLLVDGFKPAHLKAIRCLEFYMCSRFFIDYPTKEVQYAKINSYVNARFIDQQKSNNGKNTAVNFLDHLKKVVKYRARCLMKMDRRDAIHVISCIRSQLSPPKTHFLSYQFPVIAGHPQQKYSYQSKSQYNTHCSSCHQDSEIFITAATIRYIYCNESMPAVRSFPSTAYKKSRSCHFPHSR